MSILKYMFDKKYRQEFSDELTARIDRTDEKVVKAYEEGAKIGRERQNKDQG